MNLGMYCNINHFEWHIMEQPIGPYMAWFYWLFKTWKQCLK